MLKVVKVVKNSAKVVAGSKLYQGVEKFTTFTTFATLI